VIRRERPHSTVGPVERFEPLGVALGGREAAATGEQPCVPLSELGDAFADHALAERDRLLEGSLGDLAVSRVRGDDRQAGVAR